MKSESLSDNISASSSSQPPLTLVLVGVGGFGQCHLQAIEQLQKEKLVQLKCVVDPNRQSLQSEAERLSSQGVSWFLNWNELTAQTQTFDCVALCLPIPLHFEFAVKAYQTGAYVYLEKPPVPLLEQLGELVAMEGKSRRIQVGFMFPCSSVMQTIEARLREGILGGIVSYRLKACWPRNDLYYSRASWAGKLEDQGLPVLDGPATNALSHRIYDFLNIERLVTGAPALPEILSAELYRARPIDSYDVVSAKGCFPSGAEFTLALSHAVEHERELILEVTGTQGKIILRGLEASLVRNGTIVETIKPSEDLLISAYRCFLKSATARLRPKVGLTETAPYVALTNAMFRSSKTIHMIGPDYCQKTTKGFYRVKGLEQLTEMSFQTGKTFSELGAPWGIAGEKISVQTGF